jgi:hypothetical protein
MLSSRSILCALAAMTLPAASFAQSTAPTSAAATPEDVVRRYLDRGAAGDLAAVQPMLAEQCADTPVGRVEGVMVMGVRMTIRTVHTQVLSSSATEARVRYTVSGSAQGQNTTTRILGATVRIGRVRMANVTQSNVLRLVRTNGRWVIACR